jgi:glycosyltransferase involved in cell wall biosynthesis
MHNVGDSFHSEKPSALRILSYTNLFPNSLRPNFGVFIKNRLSAFADQTGSTLDVIAPVPYFPPVNWPQKWAMFRQIPRKERRDGFEVYHPRYVVFPKAGMSFHGLSMYWGTFHLVRSLHRRQAYQLIDAHWIYPDGWAAVRIAQKIGIPVVLSARGNDINEYMDFPHIRPKIQWCLEHCNHIISVCQGLKDLMVELGVPESKITVIGNGIDPKKFFPIPRVEARSKHNLPPHRPLLLSVGILEPRKGHHILIEALSVLKLKGANVPLLVIVGAGPFKAELENMAMRLGVNESVRFTGEVPHQALCGWYSAADILCLASDREGWPNVLLESMACGTPVLATRIFGVPEIVRTSEVGLLVDSRTPEAFASTIYAGLAKQWDRTKIIEYAKQHSWEKAAAGVAQVFHKVLGR